MNFFRIVPMAPHHGASMAELEKVCFSLPWSYQSCMEELRNPRGVYLAAEELRDSAACAPPDAPIPPRGTLIGYAGMQTVLDEGHITNIAVEPSFRRKGLGRALLTELIAQARLKNLQFLTLEARAGNEPAIALYRDMGFRPDGLRRNYYESPPEDALLMSFRWGEEGP